MPAAPAPHAARPAAVPQRTGEVELFGSTTRYWEYGPADAAVTILVCHGYRGDHHGLEPIAARLPDYRVVIPDLPGFGESTPMTATLSAATPTTATPTTGQPHGVAGYARWFAAFAAATGLESAVVLGHSFGSIVAAHAVAAGADAAPDAPALATSALILVNPIASDPAKAGGAGITRMYYGIARRMPERLGRALLGSPLIVSVMSRTLATTPDRELRRWIHAEHHRYFSRFSDVRTVAEGFDASLSAQVGDAAERVEVPTLLIAGALDRIAPAEGARRAVTRFRDGRLVVLPGVGHLIHYEAAEAAAAAIRAFLDDVMPA